MDEVWMPPGIAERLTVGARVRIRLSGECPHFPIELDGLAGEISYILPPGTRARYGVDSRYSWVDVRGHYYSVVPEHPQNMMGAFCWLAAAELEPLD